MGCGENKQPQRVAIARSYRTDLIYAVDLHSILSLLIYKVKSITTYSKLIVSHPYCLSVSENAATSCWSPRFLRSIACSGVPTNGSTVSGMDMGWNRLLLITRAGVAKSRDLFSMVDAITQATGLINERRGNNRRYLYVQRHASKHQKNQAQHKSSKKHSVLISNIDPRAQKLCLPAYLCIDSMVLVPQSIDILLLCEYTTCTNTNMIVCVSLMDRDMLSSYLADRMLVRTTESKWTKT
ncbi:hypothetical protein F5Y03DRAFT_166933 [Xylaria venustula]|nr:hypothetical protein F5Y03DRAFT_166933 [Xylaria venustula]